MQIVHWNWRRAAMGGALLATVLVGPVLAADTPDAWVTTKIKLALLTTSGVSSNDVSVDTIDGRVTLHGTVDTPQEKTRAEEVARGIAGVKDVRNMLAVVPPKHQKAVEVADDQIKKQVEQALTNDKALTDSSIKVASVNAGKVLLSGTATTLTDHLTAVEDAYSVHGVRQVASEIQSPDTLSDSEIWRDTKQTASKATSSASGAMSDMWITTATKVRLMANASTPATDINVDTRNGVVTLFGMVPDAASKQAAESEARKVSGVRQVRDELQIVAPSAEKAVKANDSQIKDNVDKRVDDALVDHSDIQVEVKNGVVRLSGKVDGQSDRLRALTVARATDGVRSVVDDLQVKMQ